MKQDIMSGIRGVSSRACEDCDKGKKAKNYVKVCQACEDEEKDAQEEATWDQEEKTNYAAEFCC